MTELNKSARYWMHLGLAGTVLILSMILFARINQQPLPAKSTLLKNVRSLVSYSPEFPAQYIKWKATELPDDWFRQMQDNSYKWYQFEVPKKTLDNEPWAMYLTYATRPVSVYINDQIVLKPEFNPSRVARTWELPQFIRINFEDLPQSDVDGKYVVTLQLPGSQSGSGHLGKIYIGPQDILLDAFHKINFIKITLVNLLIIAMLLSSLFVFLLWLFRRRDTVNGYYALAVAVWAIYSYSHLPLQMPISGQVWESIRMTSILFWTVSIALFCNRFLNSPQILIERILIAQAASISLCLFFIDTYYLYWLSDYILPAYTTSLGLYSSYRMVKAVIINKDPNTIWITMCGMMVMILAGHDILVMNHFMPWQDLYLHYAALILLLVFNITLIRRFVGTLNEVEQLNNNLEKRISAKTAELEANYQQLNHLERDKVLTSERERIMHDMHDGVGGTLVSLRSELERGDWAEEEIFDGLGIALDDLYMMIHSLDPYGNDLSIALGAIRNTVENRLRRANIELVWIVKEMPSIKDLAPEVVLSVMRIIQEAVTNVIKHSGASKVTICIPHPDDSETPSKASISITDDGCGFSSKEKESHINGGGYGLPGMRARAQKISGSVLIEDVNPGVRVLLQLPV